jgi:hypothetical protein
MFGDVAVLHKGSMYRGGSHPSLRRCRCWAPGAKSDKTSPVSGLQLVDGDGPARCSGCGALAAGPCARCETPLCGDCCIITDGGSKRYAICAPCARRGGASLTPGWRTVLGWILGPILLLLVIVVLLELFAR